MFKNANFSIFKNNVFILVTLSLKCLCFVNKNKIANKQENFVENSAKKIHGTLKKYFRILSDKLTYRKMSEKQQKIYQYLEELQKITSEIPA